MKFKKAEDKTGVESTNTDRTYENVVNADFVNEADDIEFKITSYNNDGSCYSKVMLGDIYLSDNLYSVIEDKLVRPEEALIRRIITRYQNTRIKLTQQINYSTSMMPITRLSDTFFVNKKFLIVGGSLGQSRKENRAVGDGFVWRRPQFPSQSPPGNHHAARCGKSHENILLVSWIAPRPRGPRSSRLNWVFNVCARRRSPIAH
jgi:hypothetical protein